MLWSAAKCCSVVKVLVIRCPTLLEDKDNMKLLIVYSLGSVSLSMYIWLYSCFNTVIYVLLLLCLCILIACLCIFTVPTDTLRLPWLRFTRAFSSAVKQMPGYNPQRRGTARTLPNFCVVLCIVCFVTFCVLCVCVCVCVQMCTVLPPGGYPISISHTATRHSR
jgi:hypothetical protein